MYSILDVKNRVIMGGALAVQPILIIPLTLLFYSDFYELIAGCVGRLSQLMLQQDLIRRELPRFG